MKTINITKNKYRNYTSLDVKNPVKLCIVALSSGFDIVRVRSSARRRIPEIVEILNITDWRRYGTFSKEEKLQKG